MKEPEQIKSIFQISSEEILLDNFFRRGKVSAKSKFFPHIYMFFFAIGWVFTFEFNFRLYVAEIFSLIGLVLIAWLSTLKRYPMARQIIGAYALWLIAIVISDFVNTTDTFDMLRNIGNPILGACSLLFVLAILSRNPNALITFLLVTVFMKGIFVDPIYGESFDYDEMNFATFREDMNYFKVRIEPFLTPFLLLVATWVGCKSLKMSILILFTTAVLYFFVDSRSIALVFLCTGLLLSLTLSKYKPKLKHIFKGGIFVALIGYLAYSVYVSYTLSYNLEGHGGKQLVMLENPYNPLELLLVGRSEWLVIPSAVYERPLYGWGSWAQDTTGWFNYLRESRLGSNSEGKSIYIPVHSTLGSVWVWSGLLGLIAMLWLFRSIVKMGIRLPYIKSNLLPVVTFFTILMVWHFFFSPPQHVRISFPIMLASLIVLTREEDKANYQRRVLSEAKGNKVRLENMHR